jgi:maltose alpha-D-glucosyltransferase/alpha-amylase
MRDNLWYKEAAMYALCIKAFKDSNSDGYGDINGLTSKLDYLQDLGVNCIMLLPIYQSPEQDNGYDVEDYYTINSYLGTLEDFKELLNQTHRKNIKVVIEMVLNHTSNTHKWFLEAVKGSDNPYHEYYIWSDTTDKFKEAKVLNKGDIQANWTYHTGCKKYYFHRYYSYEPDLNYNNPKVREEIKEILKFWFDLGVDGFLFDSVSYLFKKEGTNCENLPETYGFIKEIREMIDENYESKILMGIINKIIGVRKKNKSLNSNTSVITAPLTSPNCEIVEITEMEANDT